MTESTARAERVNPSSISSPAFTWEAPEKPVSIQMPFALIDRMEREVVENFRSLTSRGSEIGGILLGATKPGSPAIVYIDDYEVIQCDYSRGPLYRLSDADMGRFERAIEQHQAGSGIKVVGFFRSHTRKGLSLDAEDLSFFGARFRDASNVALLVRPFATKASTAGFFIWENGAVQGEASCLEFPFRSSQLSSAKLNIPAYEPAPAVNPAVSPAAAAPPSPAVPKPVVRAQIVPIASRREITLPVPPEAVQNTAPGAPASGSGAAAAVAPAREKEKPKETPAAAPAKEAAPVPENQPEKPREKAAEPPRKEAVAPPEEEEAELVESPAPSRGRTAIIGIAALVTVLVCTVLFLYPGVLRHSSRTAATSSLDTPVLALRVERTGTDILLTWNRDSVAIQKASHAVLTISDGERHENYDMDMSQLRNGSIVYSPLTADVSFKMDVTGQNNVATASESVRVLRTRPSPMSDGTQTPVEAAKPNVKPAGPAAPAVTLADAEPTTTQEAAAPAPSKAGAPSKPFNTESLAQRLRPATSSEMALPEAPSLNTTAALPAAMPAIGASPITAAPFVPSAPAPNAPAPPSEKRSATPIAGTGGQISQAQVIYSKQPEYPKLARQMGVKGSVEVLATIGADGHVKHVKVEKGHPLLVKAATDAVMQWVYKPTLLNGVPVQNDTHITLNFMGDK